MEKGIVKGISTSVSTSRDGQPPWRPPNPLSATAYPNTWAYSLIWWSPSSWDAHGRKSSIQPCRRRWKNRGANRAAVLACLMFYAHIPPQHPASHTQQESGEITGSPVLQSPVDSQRYQGHYQKIQQAQQHAPQKFSAFHHLSAQEPSRKAGEDINQYNTDLYFPFIQAETVQKSRQQKKKSAVNK